MTIQAQVLTLLQKLQAGYCFACLFITYELSVVDRLAVTAQYRFARALPGLSLTGGA